MRRTTPYPQKVRAEIISRYQQSGLTEWQFCNLEDVPVKANTLGRWLRMLERNASDGCMPMADAKATAGLNIVCYNIGTSSSSKSNEGNRQEPTLQEMIKFQKDVYDCCSSLYRLSCSKESIRLLSSVMEML